VRRLRGRMALKLMGSGPLARILSLELAKALPQSG